MCKAIFTIQTLRTILYQGAELLSCYEQHYQELLNTYKKHHKTSNLLDVDEIERLNKLIQEVNKHAIG